MIDHKRVKKTDTWDYSGGCQSCTEHEADINRFSLSNDGNMGWTFRACDNCLFEMGMMAKSFVEAKR